MSTHYGLAWTIPMQKETGPAPAGQPGELQYMTTAVVPAEVHASPGSVVLRPCARLDRLGVVEPAHVVLGSVGAGWVRAGRCWCWPLAVRKPMAGQSGRRRLIFFPPTQSLTRQPQRWWALVSMSFTVGRNGNDDSSLGVGLLAGDAELGLSRPASPDAMVDILVQSLTGKASPLAMRSEDTVGTAKARLQASEGIPINQQRLIFSGQDLLDERSLKSYGIQNEATLHIVLKEKPTASEELVAAMRRHGLSDAEQTKLYDEGVVDVQTLRGLSDELFAASGTWH